MKISSTLIQAGGNFARPTKFSLILTLPIELRTRYGHKMDILCKTTQIPSITNESYEIKVKGHPIKIPKRTHQTQEITFSFYVDESFDVRKIFQDWIYALDDRNPVARNYRTTNLLNSDNLSKFGTIELIGRDFFETSGKVITWRFEDVFPTSVGDIGFDVTAKDTITEFDVTFAFSRYLTDTAISKENIEDLDSGINTL